MLVSYVKNTYLSTCSPIRGSEQACITIVFYTTIKDREKKPFNMCVARILDVLYVTRDNRGPQIGWL